MSWAFSIWPMAHLRLSNSGKVLILNSNFHWLHLLLQQLFFQFYDYLPKSVLVSYEMLDKMDFIFFQNAIKNSSLQMAAMEQMRADENVLKLAEDQKVCNC